MPKIRKFKFRKLVYCQNQQIEDLKKKCNRTWRKYTRSKGNAVPREEHMTATAKLKKEIKKIIKKSWNQLVNDINRDPWGQAYKIVRKKLSHWQDIPKLNDPAFVERVICKLFPT